MNDFNIKLSTTNKFKVVANQGGIRVPVKLEDLIDFDATNVRDQYVLMYDSATQKYKMVNPDQVLSSAAGQELTQPGLPSDFVNNLDTDLDDRIDLDAGTF